jgi:proline iminopeptidase
MTIDLSVRLYPEIEPFQSETLSVSELHSIRVAQYGNLHGKPMLFLHGGPGSGTNNLWLRMFDPKGYRIVTFDQRGCGKSVPYACLEENTTRHLVEDIEKVRRHLNIDRWQVAGGSWGCTLALAYAQKYPQLVSSLILWGIFLGRKNEISWMYQNGASAFFPEAWEQYLQSIPPAERGDLVKAYYLRLTSADKAVRLAAAKSWCIWDASIIRLLPDANLVSTFVEDDFALAHALLECHYFANQCFLKEDGELLSNAGIIRHIPSTIIHARYDVMCPLETAWELHKALPQAEFIVVPDAGHSAREPSNARAITLASDKHLALP